MKLVRQQLSESRSPVVSIDTESFFSISKPKKISSLSSIKDPVEVNVTFNVNISKEIEGVQDFDRVDVSLLRTSLNVEEDLGSSAPGVWPSEPDTIPNIKSEPDVNFVPSGRRDINSFMAGRGPRPPSPSSDRNNSRFSTPERSQVSNFSAVNSRLSSGTRMRARSANVTPPLKKTTVSLARYLSKNYRVSYTAITIPISSKKSERGTNAPTVKSLDPRDLIDRVNSDLVDLTEIASDERVSSITSETLIDEQSFKNVLGRKSDFYLDSIKYLLHDIPDDVPYQKYKIVDTEGHLNSIPVSVVMTVDRSDVSFQPLKIKIELYEKNQRSPRETLVKEVNVRNYLESVELVLDPPEVTVKRYGDSTHQVTILDKDPRKSVKEFKVYLRSIDDKGTFSDYKLIKSVKSSDSGEASLSVKTSSNLSSIKVVPVLKTGKDSFVFTNKILGPGHSSVGNLTLVVSQTNTNDVRIDLFNIPKSASSISIYKRYCGTMTSPIPSSKFELLQTVKSVSFDDKGDFTTFDKDIGANKIYEYYASIETSSARIKDARYVSNMSWVHTMISVGSRPVTVSLTDFSTSVDDTGNICSFNITSTVTARENEKVTKEIEKNIPEVYDQYLNPQNNNVSPLEDNGLGYPSFSDLFVHQVVRTNLSTAKREVFDIVSDGVFYDNFDSRTKSGVTPIDTSHSYLYQIFTYKKDPFEMFKGLVAYGVNESGKEYFFLPYKWNNPSAKSGTLLAEDDSGYPLTPSSESFLDNPCGMTASRRVYGSASYVSVKNVSAKRIDRDTNKVTWEAYGANGVQAGKMYDSFIVLKTVNGTRKFMNRTSKNYIYHRLSDEDLGSIYYTVVPVLKEMSLDQYAHSNVLLVRPDGIVPVVLKARTGNLDYNNDETFVSNQQREELNRQVDRGAVDLAIQDYISRLPR